jgi:hypothetical protein
MAKKNALVVDATLVKEMGERIEEVSRVMELAFAALAEEIRTGYVVPVCREHRLKFMQGNGCFYFTPVGEDDSITSIEDAPRNLRRVLGPIFEVLNLPIADRQLLGYLMTDFDPGEP